jgi:hypothetical protein
MASACPSFQSEDEQRRAGVTCGRGPLPASGHGQQMTHSDDDGERVCVRSAASPRQAATLDVLRSEPPLVPAGIDTHSARTLVNGLGRTRSMIVV